MIEDPVIGMSNTPNTNASPAARFRDSPQAASDDPVASSPILNGHAYTNNATRGTLGRRSLSPSIRAIGHTETSFHDDDAEVYYDEAPSQNGDNDNHDDMDDAADPGANGKSRSSNGRGHRSNKGSLDVTNYSELSQRADQIMDHARRKLSALEGNLKGARHSLLSPSSTSPRSIDGMKFPMPARSQSSAMTAEEEERLRARGPKIRFGQPRQTSASVSPAMQRVYGSENQSPGHNRVYSETSVPSGLGFPIKGSRALDDGQIPLEATQHSPSMAPRPPRSASALSSYSTSGPGSRRVSALTQYQASPSTRDLRGKAEELKGRLSFIQERVREDAYRRTSFQSVRSMSDTEEDMLLSEVTELEQTIEEQEEAIEELEHRQERESYAPPKTEDSSGEEEAADDYSTDESPELSGPENRPIRGILKGTDQRAALSQRQNDSRAEWHRVLNENHYDLETGSISPGSESDEEHEYEFESVLEEQLDDDEVAMEGAHEDRADAFDYEHFILHSALGSYASGRPVSSRSGSSASTTRGPLLADNKASDQLENLNSSVNSFQTADEDLESDSGSEGAEWSDIDNSWPVPPASGRQSRSGQSHNGASHASRKSRHSGMSGMRGLDSHHRPASVVFSALLKPESEANIDDEDRALIRSISEELSQLCLRLTTSQIKEKETAEVRLKLQQIKATLVGEESTVSDS